MVDKIYDDNCEVFSKNDPRLFYYFLNERNIIHYIV